MTGGVTGGVTGGATEGGPAGGRAFGADEVDVWFDAMAEALARHRDAHPDLAFIGVRRGGVDVAHRLHARVAPDAPFGELDIAFYRDDFATLGLHPRVGPSAIDFDVAGRSIVLVDDVLGTGRTVRAALNEIFDWGRPASVLLAVLVERGDRELPIRADVAGARPDVRADERVDFDPATGTVSIGPAGARAAAPAGGRAT